MKLVRKGTFIKFKGCDDSDEVILRSVGKLHGCDVTANFLDDDTVYIFGKESQLDEFLNDILFNRIRMEFI